MPNSEKGYTLIELLMAIAITSVILLGLTMTITTFQKNYKKTTDHSIVQYQVQNANNWISRDVAMASNMTLSEPGGFPLTLNIPVDNVVSNDYSVDYYFDGDQLKRKLYDSSHILISETGIADYVDSAVTTFMLADNATGYQLFVSATKRQVTLEMDYYILQKRDSH